MDWLARVTVGFVICQRHTTIAVFKLVGRRCTKTTVCNLSAACSHCSVLSLLQSRRTAGRVRVEGRRSSATRLQLRLILLLFLLRRCSRWHEWIAEFSRRRIDFKFVERVQDERDGGLDVTLRALVQQSSARGCGRRTGSSLGQQRHSIRIRAVRRVSLDGLCVGRLHGEEGRRGGGGWQRQRWQRLRVARFSVLSAVDFVCRCLSVVSGCVAHPLIHAQRRRSCGEEKRKETIRPGAIRSDRVETETIGERRVMSACGCGLASE